jgi:hypothetical protein
VLTPGKRKPETRDASKEGAFMTTKKPAKSGVKKMQIKKQTLKDLDAKSSAKNVRGGNKPRASAAMNKC